jgi:hypothetical protein
MILHGNAGEMGKYAVLSVLPDKMARFLYEYHDTSYTSLGLPPIPLDRSFISVHSILRPDQVQLCDLYLICKICTICKTIQINEFLHILHMSIFCIFVLHILHINTEYAEQNRALLDNSRGHIVLYATLLIGHTQHKGHMRVSSWPFVPRKLQQTNCQDIVFIRPSGISDGASQLRMDTYGSANFCSCSKSIQRQTLGFSTTSAPMFQCWKNKRAHENQVIFCIFCIFCIF